MNSLTPEQPGGSHACLENPRSQFLQQACFQHRWHSPGVLSLPRQKSHQTHLAPRLSPPLPRPRAAQHTCSLGGGGAGHCGSCGHFGVGSTPKMSEKTLWLASDSRHLHQGEPAVLRSTPSPPHTRQLPRALCAPCSSLVSLFSSESRQISVTFMAKSKN